MARSFFLFLAVLTWLVSPAWAEKKVALVIGNSNYKHATPLPNPTNDARAMSRMLEKIGFEVVSGTDLDRQAMADSMKLFAAKAENADTVLYFYAGHGIQVDGQNYLIPIDADLATEMDVKLSTLDIDLMLQQTPVTARVKLVLLDACRNNPFKAAIARSMGKTRSAAVGNGLAEMKPTFGTLIAYATGPGEVALDGETQNSPFTTALLKYLPEAGLEIGQAMTRVRKAVYEETGNSQLPWENKNLTSDYYLVAAVAPVDDGGKVAAESPVAATLQEQSDPSAKSHTAQNGEIILWQAVKDSTDPVEVQAYLDRYGDEGIFANTARKRIESLNANQEPVQSAALEKADPPKGKAKAFQPNPAIMTTAASSASESELDLGKTDKKILVIKLSSLGFATRSLSAEFDAATRIALAKWQEARGYPVTGFLNKFQYEALLYDDDERAPLPEVIQPVQKLPEVEVVEPPSVKKYKAPERVIVVAPPKQKKVKPVVLVEPVVKRKVKVAPPPAKKIVRQQPAINPPKRVAVVKKVKRPVVIPKIGISIGSGGNIGLSLGF